MFTQTKKNKHVPLVVNYNVNYNKSLYLNKLLASKYIVLIYTEHCVNFSENYNKKKCKFLSTESSTVWYIKADSDGADLNNT